MRPWWVVGAAAAAAIGWAVTPWVSMARRGTLDEQTLAGWGREYRIPRPRSSPDDEAGAPRTSGARGRLLSEGYASE